MTNCIDPMGPDGLWIMDYGSLNESVKSIKFVDFMDFSWILF